MRANQIATLLVMGALTWAAGSQAENVPEQRTPSDHPEKVTTATPPATVSSPDRIESDTLIGDYGGIRPWLKDLGITLKPRITEFYQGMTAGDGDHNFEYGGKADLWLMSDLNKLGLWTGLSVTIHGEANFGESVNGLGGTMVPINTALQFPGSEGIAAADWSSVYFGQRIGETFSMLIGKINMIDIAASKPFMGGAGIDSFWNTTFVAPPSGLVPPYLFGTLLSLRTQPAVFGFWIYDPDSKENKTGFEEPFATGITFRGSVDFPVTLVGRGGHQGLVALYSTEKGTDLASLSDLFIPPVPAGTPGVKEQRYYFAYLFDQYLYQSEEDPKQGVGLFGQFGISDGNPTRLHWSTFAGVGGTGLIPGRNRDNWGAGYYFDSLSGYLKDSLAATMYIRDEQAFEAFYNFVLIPGFILGADVQVTQPSFSDTTAVFPGLRAVLNF